MGTVGTWAQASWWAGGLLAVVALAIVAAALFRDRPRGRRRCPGCWYDMSGVVGMTCPECGRTQKSEKRFFKTRPRWRLAVVGGLVLVLAGGTALAPAMYTGKWAAYTPVPVLRIVLSWFHRDAADVSNGVAGGTLASNLTTWGRLLLASALAGELRRESGSTPNAAWPLKLIYDEAGDLGDEARPMLPEMVSDFISGQPVNSQRAGWAIVKLGGSAGPVAPRLRRFLQIEGNEARRLNGVRVLVGVVDRSDERTFGVLRALSADDPDEGIRLEATAGMIVMRPSSELCVERLVGLGDAKDPAVRLAAVHMLGWYARARSIRGAPWQASDRCLGMLTFSCASAEFPVRQPSDRAVTGLAAALSDEDAGVRRCAIDMLGAIDERVAAVIDQIRGLMERDRDPALRLAAINAYVQAPRAEVGFLLPELVPMLDAESTSERWWAAAVLKRCGRRAVGLTGTLKSMAEAATDTSRQRMICEVLGALGPEGWRILDEFQSGACALNGVAANALGVTASRDAEAADYLVSSLRDGDEGQRLRAARAMKFFDGAAKFRALSAAVLKDPVVEVRRAALRSVADHGDEDELLGVLFQVAHHEDEGLRGAAMQMIGLHGVAGKVMLERLMLDGDETVRASAMAQLRHMQGE